MTLVSALRRQKQASIVYIESFKGYTETQRDTLLKKKKKKERRSKEINLNL